MTQSQKDHFHSPESARAAARAALAPRQISGTSRTWDHFVFFMRTTLPVATIILGVMTLMWPFLNDQEVSFHLSKEEVASSDGKVRMTGMRYVGTDAVNRLFKVQAASGIQDNPDEPRIRLSDIQAEMELNENLSAKVTALEGVYSTNTNLLRLSGGVALNADNGYSLTMREAQVDLTQQVAIGQGDISGQAPVGDLTAERIEIHVDKAEAIFTGGVHMTINPKRPSASQNR